MHRRLIFLLLGMFLISVASASLPPVKQNDCAEIRTVLNASAVNLSSISYPNDTVIYLDTPMNNTAGKTFNLTFCGTDTWNINDSRCDL